MSRSGSGLVDLGAIGADEMAAWRKKQQRPRLAHLGISATWPELVRAEPRLDALMREVRVLPGLDYDTCSTQRWYGWKRGAKSGIKHRVKRLCGDDTAVFWAAVRALQGSLRLCRHCLERDPLEADIEWDIARTLKAQGHDVATQVWTPSGVADVVTEDMVIEVKLWLSRVSMFQAVGQVSVYAAELGRPKRAIVGQATRETASLLAGVRRLGIMVKEW
jgi:hypothetical protein